MKSLIILFISGLLLTSCAKDEQDPIYNDNSLIGYWISEDGRIIFDIKDVKGGGIDERYEEYYQNGNRYFKRYFNGLQTIYQIQRITPYDLEVTSQFPTSTYIKLSRLK